MMGKAVSLSPATRACHRWHQDRCGYHPGLADSPWAIRRRPLRGFVPAASFMDARATIDARASRFDLDRRSSPYNDCRAFGIQKAYRCQQRSDGSVNIR